MRWFGFFWFVAIIPSSAAEQWLRLTTPHFELLTTAGERKGREGIQYFETVRQFFVDARLAGDTPGKRIRIVAFRGEKDFRPYAPNEVAAAFYAGGADNDYIVMSQIGFEYYPVAVHEYTHLVLRHAFREFPPWFNEGLAELFSTLRPDGKRVAVGDIIPGHLREARENRLIDLDTLLAVNHESKLYNERSHAGMFYSESWLLVHMLFLQPDYRPHFLAFLKAMTSGQASAPALQEAFGKSLPEIQKDLSRYIAEGPKHNLLASVQLDRHAENPDVQQVDTWDADLALAEIMSTSQRQAPKAREMLAQLMAQQPKRPEPAGILAEIALREGRRQEAVDLYAKAVELGSTNPELYFRYAMLIWNRSNGRDEAILRALRKAVELQPDYAEARLRLGFALMDHSNYKEALLQFGQVRNLKPEDAFSFFRAIAYAEYRLGEKDAARLALAKASQYAKSPTDRMEVEQLSRALEPSKAAAAPAPAVAQTETVETVAPPSHLPTMAGTLDELECSETHARLAILANGHQVWFLIHDPGSVRMTNTGAGSGAMDFTCGKQKPRPVEIEYVDRPDSETKTVGLVKGIEFK